VSGQGWPSAASWDQLFWKMALIIVRRFVPIEMIIKIKHGGGGLSSFLKLFFAPRLLDVGNIYLGPRGTSSDEWFASG
jgi:hypothetical protein